MTGYEFTQMRRRMQLTQSGLADALGMSLRSIQSIETGHAPVRTIHILALERISLTVAASLRDPYIAASSVADDAHILISDLPK